MTTPSTSTPTTDETQEAREQVAARLERLAHRLRTQTSHATVEQFDRAYSAVITLAQELYGMQGLLDERPSTRETPV